MAIIMASKHTYFAWLAVCLFALYGVAACTGGTGGDRQNDVGGGGKGTNTGASNAANAATGAGGTGFNITELSPDCGNGSLQGEEQCDDGNDVGGDGCNIACQQEIDWDCPVPGQPCVSTVTCGDGFLSSVETCDDANTVDGDGCSADCLTIETGWQCRAPGKACIPLCGDQMLTGGENCDDGNAVSGDGCTSTCLTEPGWSCTGTTCTQAVCGNGVQETGENCDLGEQNGLFYGDGTGCSKTCTQEPNCRPNGTTQACSTACGDGNKDDLDGETCDDGNAVDGDGCSSTCQLEEGFTCEDVLHPDTEPCSSGTGECLVVPIIYRDFDGENEPTGHPDFFYLGGTRTCVPNASGQQDTNPITDNGGPCWATDSTDLCQGLINPNLAADGKPEYSGSSACTCRFTDWDGTGLIPATNNCWEQDANPARAESTVNVIQSAASFNQWYHDDASVNTTVPSTLELEPIGGNRFQFSSSDGLTVYDDIAEGAGTTLDSGFFPLEDQARPTVCNLWPYWTADAACIADEGNTPSSQWDETTNAPVAPVNGIDRNFYFSTEVRYLFRYAGGETLEFFGDDDVWVFINGVLALDLGAPHERLQGTVALDNGAWTISAENPATGDPIAIANGTQAGLGLEVGRIYEIAVFHADRHPRESNYQLTLSGFSTNKAECLPTCGDGVVTTGEECDEGGANADGVYGGCTTQCKWGPFCGDSVVDAGYEDCDLGRENRAQYGQDGCTSACTTPHFCGDGFIDGAFGEQCDDGPNNGIGQCQTDCTIQLR